MQTYSEQQVMEAIEKLWRIVEDETGLTEEKIIWKSDSVQWEMIRTLRGQNDGKYNELLVRQGKRLF